MLNPKKYLESLIENEINFYAGVPDSLLKSFCACVTDQLGKDDHVITANEGAAIGQAIGYYLGTKKVPLVYLQNSGLGNIINPLLSLASNEVYGIPMMIMIGWRGEPGVKDEPQHIHQGRVMLDMLKAMDIPYIILEDNLQLAKESTINALNIAKKDSTPVAILVKKNTFSEYLYKNDSPFLEMSREEAIITTAKKIPNNAAIISTTGMPSRELYEFRESSNAGHHMDFLTVGGMGHASQIAISLAKIQKNRPIFCFDGDGAALMHMGSFATIGQSDASNFNHIIFNNGVHDSVGGQPTVGFQIDFQGIASACGYKNTLKVQDFDELKSAIEFSIQNRGPNLIDVRVKPGNRKDIGRPKSSPQENKIEMMNYLLNIE